ncbi:Katanin p80 WD40 repeat-containing subunit B1 [Diplonema papillatum]|nr:Katanin p80 WD40 repeat-containing subunit B1 [Diplonema papillatum]
MASDAPGRKAKKVQEFMANQPDVLCCRFSTNENETLLATGGTDHRVGVWKSYPSRSACVASLEGPASSVTACVFSTSPGMQETQSVVAGDKRGVLRLWDIRKQEETRVYATTCHKAIVTSVDYHPFGDFFVSTSLDGNVKVWDLRKKTCLQTYKYQEGKRNGHPGAWQVRFSPDGRLVASGNADGTVVLWDLTKGQRLQTLQHHTEAITTLDFHPLEFILGVGSRDGTVSYWDIDKGKNHLLASSAKASESIDRVHFSPDGSALLSCRETGLDVLGWGSVPLHDQVTQSWGRIGAITCCNSTKTMYTASYDKSFVSIHAVQLSTLAPFKSAGTGVPSSAAKSAPVPQKANQNQVGQPSGGHQQGALPVFPVTGDDNGNAAVQRQQHIGGASSLDVNGEHRQRDRDAPPPAQVQAVDAPLPPPTGLPTPASHVAHKTRESDRSERERSRADSAPTRSPGAHVLNPGSAQPKEEVVLPRSQSMLHPPARQAGSKATTAISDAAFGRRGVLPPTSASKYHDLTEPLRTAEATPQLLAVQTSQDSHAVHNILSMRLMHIRVIRALWAREPRDAVQHLIDSYRDDPTIAADFLTTLTQSDIKRSLTLELSCMLIPVAADLLQDCFETYMRAAVQAACVIFAIFGGHIHRANQQGGAQKRQFKYMALADSFRSMRPRLKHIAENSRMTGTEAAKLLRDMEGV